MNLHDTALVAAGVIGGGTAIVHGILTQRLMVNAIRLELREAARINVTIQRLVPMLLQFSTFNWLFGGAMLIGAALWFGHDAQVVAGVLVGSSYLYGALGNFQATRGRHPGWMLMAVAVVLIGYALIVPGS